MTGSSPKSDRRRVPSFTSPAVPDSNTLSPIIADPAFANTITESPQSTSTSHVYPPIGLPPKSYPSPYLPRTPVSQTRHNGSHYMEDSLSQVDESGTDEREYPTVSQSSRAPLLAVKQKDYAADVSGEDEERSRKGYRRNGGLQEADERDTGVFKFNDSPLQSPMRTTAGSSRVIPTIASPSASPLQPPKQRTVDPNFMPRPGPADAYISRFLSPIPASAGTQPPSPEPIDGHSSFFRPSAPLRATSAPGVPLASLVTSSLSAPSGPPKADEEASDAHPLFKIFSAQLDVSAEEMVRRLKGHLGDVLKVQDEIGDMHLKLAGLGTEKRDEGSLGLGIKTESTAAKESSGKDSVKEMIDRREKGIEEIMQKLGSLSDSLRQYHHLGTPKMSFPPSSKPSSAYPYSPSPTPLTSTPPPFSAGPAAYSSPTSSANRHPPGHPLGSPPKIHSGHGESSRLGPLSSTNTTNAGLRGLTPTSPKAQQRHAPKIPSNLDQVTTADEEEEEEIKERDFGAQTIGRNGGSTAVLGRDNHPDELKKGDIWMESKSADLGGGENYHSSPMEMADRSRPW